jgi:DNA uptake protein ComE-like DNA-binding protein
MIKKLLWEIYMLPRGEQRALIVLSFMLLFSLSIRIGVQLLPGREPAGIEEFEKEYQTLMAALARSDSIKNAASGSNVDSVTRHPSPVTSRSKSSPVTSHSESSTTSTRPLFPNHRSPININRADSAQLLPLPGIGPVFAGRIIRFRDLLGGYVRVEQLGEVYGLQEETLDLIRDQIIIDTVNIRKIFIDSASFSELLRHPYLDLDQVKSLVEYRDFKKDISSLEELRENFILEDSTLNRISPYLKFR